MSERAGLSSRRLLRHPGGKSRLAISYIIQDKMRLVKHLRLFLAKLQLNSSEQDLEIGERKPITMRKPAAGNPDRRI